MLTFLLLFGFFSIIFIPMLCMFYSEAKLTTDESKKILFWLSFLPGTSIFLLYAFLKPDAPPVIPSQDCGVIQFYQFNARRGGYFERVSIRFDGAQYNRHLFFDKHLKKIPQGQKACFEYLDKFKYPHLAESKLVKWIEPS
ncbi:hypothetical protein L1A45_16670 [Acinetobacter variabilis]|uniref:hypothetical protein n=1 Tax=Acinetobacter TaxID=469 RepID=UPI0015D2160C|nr:MULTISPECIES: hypothetical protein [Acinetobacter]UNW06210.1 hypothetical protein MOV98_11150 [Acinetobacter variabilis]WKT72331.1 hypothetical protein Q3F87_10790 [Acinetobacter variabilis]WPC35820.1 hypothetical protein O4M77_05250 [Acinetobacter sp. YWS30-1]